MNIVTVYYPQTEKTHFDLHYYVDKHVGYIRNIWDDFLEDIQLLHGIDTLRGGQVPFHMIAVLRFKSSEALKQAFSMEEAQKMPADIANFTNTTPAMAICESVIPH